MSIRVAFCTAGVARESGIMSELESPEANEANMDILDAIGIRLPCRSCGEPYEVPLRDIHLSHEVMNHEGCPASEETECPPIFQVFLADDEDIIALQHAWQRLQERARKDGGELVLMGHLMKKSGEDHARAA